MWREPCSIFSPSQDLTYSLGLVLTRMQVDYCERTPDIRNSQEMQETSLLRKRPENPFLKIHKGS